MISLKRRLGEAEGGGPSTEIARTSIQSRVSEATRKSQSGPRAPGASIDRAQRCSTGTAARRGCFFSVPLLEARRRDGRRAPAGRGGGGLGAARGLAGALPKPLGASGALQGPCPHQKKGRGHSLRVSALRLFRKKDQLETWLEARRGPPQKRSKGAETARLLGRRPSWSSLRRRKVARRPPPLR